jgi:hypothetical protein
MSQGQPKKERKSAICAIETREFVRFYRQGRCGKRGNIAPLSAMTFSGDRKNDQGLKLAFDPTSNAGCGKSAILPIYLQRPVRGSMRRETRNRASLSVPRQS